MIYLLWLFPATLFILAIYFTYISYLKGVKGHRTHFFLALITAIILFVDGFGASYYLPKVINSYHLVSKALNLVNGLSHGLGSALNLFGSGSDSGSGGN